MIRSRPSNRVVPSVILAVLIAAWVVLGVRLIADAPFASGTDESINYVAFAAAKNRWATEEDFRRWGIDYFYYPPLYFLCFAPFYGDNPEFVERYPRGKREDPNYLNKSGRNMMSADYLSRIPASLDRLYREAKGFSLMLGLVVLLCLTAVLAFLFPGPDRWWLVLLGAGPLVCLPQFLYYHTLCNNDSLVNALGALTALLFVAAVLSLERGRRGGFTAFAVLAAVSAGLAVLTKMSGPVLLPYLAGLVAARFLDGAGEPPRVRLRRTLLFGCLVLAVTILAGGWWILYKWSQGDWNSFKAHQIAHPWAAGASISPADFSWAVEQALGIARSYYSLFTGLLYVSVPDLIFMAWLLVPLSGVTAPLLLLLTARRKTEAASKKMGAAPLRRFLWTTLAAAAAFNLVLVTINLLQRFEGAYGRLFFPTAVAWHALWAYGIARLLQRFRKLLAPGILLLLFFLGFLFCWTFVRRMSPAVSQTPEEVRLLLYSSKRVTFGPVWNYPYSQLLSIPPGELAALRLKIVRSSLVPLWGASMGGTLRLRRQGGDGELIRLKPAALGDWDYCRRWIELELDCPVRLEEHTDAVLSVESTRPRWLPAVSLFRYDMALDVKYEDVAAARIPVMPQDLTLCVAAVYRRSPATTP